LSDDLAKRFPEGTLVRFNYLPTIHAQLRLNRNDPAKAIESLEAAAPYELGAHHTGAFPPAMYPVYVRGQAYLAMHQGDEAAAQFQKILDHPGIVLNEPIGALAHLGLGRAYALEAGIPGSAGVPPATRKQESAGKMPAFPGDALARARKAYQDFFALWKDADPDIPILKQAQREYAELK